MTGWRAGVRACVIAALGLVLAACGGSEDPGMDVGGERVLDVPAGEITQYREAPVDHCVGRIRQDAFALYDEECTAVEGLGECLIMENPHDGQTFYCSLCGLKGSEMVCYMIQQQ